ncbi:GNAT family N-acetyltransferase [Thalassococcus lentus]|uniref:GNAT family N-acetyltransferase n=1 Tax=Thalassococcus lentus TaxID=1210524 RepID=A0ABT4XRB5_9RHOB|nr:GNAT family N-acetyltransferase [Thalassococcus lentus]MDA7424499.1 GNAT family N-acetyltransferase [Thalassococcus lentus]
MHTDRMRVEITDKSSEDADKRIDKGLDDHVEDLGIAAATCRDLYVYCYSDDGATFLGGLRGNTGNGWFHIWQFWVDRDHRGGGLGTQILQTAEAEARKRGCHSAHVDTLGHQAPDFYRKHGYTCLGELENYVATSPLLFFRKSLA